MRRSPLDAFFENAQRRPDTVALRYKTGGSWQETTWAGYARDVRRAGRALIQLGIAAGGRIVILGPNRPEWVIADLGAMAAGVAPAGIYGTSTPDQVAYITAHAEAPLAVVENHKQLAKFRAHAAQLPLLKHFVLMQGEPQAPDEMTWAQFLALGDPIPEAQLDERLAAIKKDDVASLIYTSGTTGTPKAVMITHGNVLFAAEANQSELGISEHEHLISYLPLSHIAEQVLTMHGAAVIGYTVSFCDSLDKIAEALREVQPTIFFGVPRVWEKMQAKMVEAGKKNSWLKRKIAAWARGVGLRAGYARQQGKPLPFGYGLAKKLVFSQVRERLGFQKLWFAVVGAAPIARSTLEFFLSLDLPIYEVYGMSEVTGAGSLSTPKAFRTASVGRVLTGTEIKIAEDGEILMRGPHVFKGYLKDPVATQEAIDSDGWLHSGDVGEFDADRFLRITDRKKDLFKTAGGKYIAPQNLEGLLKGIPGVGQAVVIGEGRKYAVALLTLDPEACAALGKSAADLAGDRATVTRLEQAVNQVNTGLAPYETIKRIKVLPTEFTIESGELTPTMKLKRKVVSQRYAKEIESLYSDA